MDYEELAGLSRRRLTLSFSMPMSLIEVVDRIAASEGLRMSTSVFERLLRKGLAVERDERERKANT